MASISKALDLPIPLPLISLAEVITNLPVSEPAVLVAVFMSEFVEVHVRDIQITPRDVEVIPGNPHLVELVKPRESIRLFINGPLAKNAGLSPNVRRVDDNK